MNQPKASHSADAGVHPEVLPWPGLLAALLLGVALMLLAWPALKATFRFLPVETAVGDYWEGETIEAPQLRALAIRAEQAVEIHEQHRFLEDLSLLHYLRAINEATPAWERRKAMRSSERAAVRAAELAPANPGTWLRIAQARSLLGMPDSQVVAPLKMSMLIGRVEPTLLVPRLELGLRYLPEGDAESEALLRDQAVLAWRVSPSAFNRSLRNARLDRARLGRLLRGSHPDIIESIEVQWRGTVR